MLNSQFSTEGNSLICEVPSDENWELNVDQISLCDLSPFFSQKGIEAPDARAGRRKKQEIETEHHGDLAEVVDREKASRKMRAEISNGHFTGQNECHRTGEQAHKH